MPHERSVVDPVPIIIVAIIMIIIIVFFFTIIVLCEVSCQAFWAGSDTDE